LKWLTFKLFFLLIFFYSGFIFSQSKIETYLKPSDSLDNKRLKTVVITEGALASGALIGLSELWYNDYPKSSFHFINDNSEWLQMDKIGHIYSSYHIGKIGASTLKWSGVSRKKQLIYGATLGFAFLSIVEVFDGYSTEWGASSGDIIANATGTTLYVSQELLWKEQRIIPKFSFHTTSYAAYRPNVLGSSFSEQLLKDYNGQTYWLSANINSFYKNEILPKWLNLAIGYGAEGMISGNVSSNTTNSQSERSRFRQFYVSFDVDLSKIETKSQLLKTFFSIFNTIKIPAPTFEINASEASQFHLFYF
jgi:hypothetical protein